MVYDEDPYIDGTSVLQSSWRMVEVLRKKRPFRSIDVVKHDQERKDAMLVRDDECQSEMSLLKSKRKYQRDEF